MNSPAWKIRTMNLTVDYRGVRALSSVSLDIAPYRITALMGPSGCGKSTFLRCLNRMCELAPGTRIRGRVLLDGGDVYDGRIDVADLRRRVGMVFQKPNPFHATVFENVAYGLRVQGIRDRHVLEKKVRRSLEAAALWEEVGDGLHRSALSLSAGQLQRLCIARALAVEPEVLLLDEPTGALDPMATARIEELIRELGNQYTIVIVTQNVQQAARLGDVTAFFHSGELIEVNQTQVIFTNPSRRETEDYVTGRFG